MKVIVFTNLFPNTEAKQHGIFVYERLRHLRARHGVEAEVVAPVPYFPKWKGFGPWSRMARIPREETLDGFRVHHPRYLVTPKVGMSLYPMWMALGTRSLMRRLVSEGAELIDAHYIYPDGVAATWLARRLGVPVVLTSRGTDINDIPRYSIPRRQIRWALRHAQGRAAVCGALRDAMIELEPSAPDVEVLRNGVDSQKFSPVAMDVARRKLGLEASPARLLISVGQLIERKGPHLLIDALNALDSRDTHLVFVGRGPMEGTLREQAQSAGLKERVHFVGQVPHEDLRDYYAAGDVSVLASSREGWANVLLESMACGTPVVATRIWGTPEVVNDDGVGLLVERDVASLRDGISRALARDWDRGAIRHHALKHTWEETSDRQWAQFQRVLEREESAVLRQTPRERAQT